uniref:Endoplasmic reticulum transmembrane protein n=1 Tax=Kalanchoe fedtschenkoi TaxID=63787 RepID=A0A7N0RJ19_KALFE
MIQLLFTVIGSEMALILALLFKTPLRKLAILALDKVKRGRGPVVAKTVAATVFMVMMSSVWSIVEIQQRLFEAGAVNPTDQVLMAVQMLEASLMGFMLFLALMIDRLHHYIRELRMLRKTMDAARKQSRSFDDSKNGHSEELKAMQEEVASLKKKIKGLESECEVKTGEARAEEAHSDTLKKQSEGFLQEHGRLLEENDALRSQLQAGEAKKSF